MASSIPSVPSEREGRVHTQFPVPSVPSEREVAEYIPSPQFPLFHHMHVLRLFIKPEDLVSMCARSGLSVHCLRGIAPVVFSIAFWKMFFLHTVADSFTFRFTQSTRISYSGFARKIPRL